jgi:Protein of unknown function (DUF2809)
MRSRWPNPLARMALLAITVVLGLGSRRLAAFLPGFIVAYAGDISWALALYLFLGLILPRWTTGRLAALALLLSLSVEVSQLYHAPWIDSIRQTAVGGLILGFSFLWSDLVCYAAGVGLGVALEWGLPGSHRHEIADSSLSRPHPRQ